MKERRFVKNPEQLDTMVGARLLQYFLLSAATRGPVEIQDSQTVRTLILMSVFKGVGNRLHSRFPREDFRAVHGRTRRLQDDG